MNDIFLSGYWKNNIGKIQERHKIAYKFIDKNTKRLLDIGCGDGTFLSYVKSKNSYIGLYGADISHEAIQKAKDKGFDVFVMDFDNDKLNSEYEAITLLDVLEHTLNPENVLSKCLDSSKYCIIAVPNFSYIEYRIMMFLGKIPSVSSENKGHMFFFNEKKLNEIIRRSKGIVIKKSYYYPYMHHNKLGKISSFICSLNPSLFSTMFVYKIKKGES